MDSNVIPNFWNTDNLNYQRIVLHPKFKARSLDRPKLEKESFPHSLGELVLDAHPGIKEKLRSYQTQAVSETKVIDSIIVFKLKDKAKIS